MKDAKLYKFLIPLMALFMKFFYRAQIVNKEYILENEAIVLCGNHTSNLDSILVGASIKRNIYFLAKSELFKGIKKHFFKSVGCIPVDRKTKNPDAVNDASDLLNNKQIVCIFPEGTINKTKDIIMPFKYGAVSLASKTNSYLIPFSITGKYKLFKKSVKIEFLEPYKVAANLEKENKILMNKIKKSIIENRGKNE